MFHISHLSFYFDDQCIFDDISFDVHLGDVVGVVGDNGAGKSTLLNLITGNLSFSKGSIDVDHQRVGYVPQAIDETLRVKDVFSSNAQYWQIESALEEVNLEPAVFYQEIGELSGGQQTRLSIASVLANDFRPDILLLDEPTNNIDLQGRKWLADYIQAFRGCVIIASHDRAFLNEVVNQVLEVVEKKINIYHGNYDLFKAEKQKEFERSLERYEQYQSSKNRLLRVRNTKKAQSHKTSTESFHKTKHESKMSFDAKKNSSERVLGKQIKALESRIEQLEAVDKPKIIKQRSVSLEGKNARSKIVLSIDSISKHFDYPVIEDFSLEIRGGDRIHLKGYNGVGKTTLLKIIAGLLEPDSGTIKLGTGIKLGYFSQVVTDIDLNKTGLENLLGSCDDRNLIYRSAAGFGFNELDLNQKVRRMSRGQQAKISFVKLLLSNNHLLVLDEPTNHLDIRTKEQIEEALQGYDGALIVASHDQYFIDSIECNIEVALEH